MALGLRSPLLAQHGFAHAFTERAGGFSLPPFDSLNFEGGLGDSKEAIVSNHELLAFEVGYRSATFFEATQVHGAEVFVVDENTSRDRTRKQEADALQTDVLGWAVGVRTADCLPLLLADPSSRCVAAVHAGWRGTVAGIVSASVARFEKRGVSGSRIVAAIGPHIRACCFEVGDEVLAGLKKSSGIDVSRPGKGKKPHADLGAAVIAELRARGVTMIDDTGGCTFCEPERFYSFRRDGKKAGRMMSVIRA